MSDIPALPSAIGIEAVECVADTPSGMTVRVTGRWRRRRPEWHGPAMLVIEAGERRQRIPAMPEPPSLTGTLPGTWRMSFSVPDELVEHLKGRTWLQLGAVMAPLALAGLVDAAAGRAPAAPAPVRPPVDPELLAERERLGYEFAAQSARRRAEEAEARVSELQAEIGRLEQDLSAARREPELLQAEVAERERRLRSLRQRLHAEAAVRSDTERELAEREREIERLRERARRLLEREHELEADLRRARRAADEAEHHAAAARAELSRTSRRVDTPEAPREPPPEPPAEPPPAPPPAPRAPSQPRTSSEAGLVALACTPATPRRPATPPRPLADALEREQALLARARTPHAPPALELSSTREALRRERAAAAEVIEREREGARATLERERERMRAEREAELAREREAMRAALERAAAPADDAEVRVLRSARENLARELASVRLELSREREGRRRAEERLAALEADLEAQRERSTRALRAIVDFRGELQALRRTPATAAEDEVEPARLSAALERLREQHPSADAEADRETHPSETHTGTPPGPPPGPAPDALPRLFRRLAREDPGTAGRLVLQLLPAQPLVHPRPVAYDLVLGPGSTVQVTSTAGGSPRIELAAGPRSPDQTQFRIEGDQAALARALAAGPLRRRLTRRGARVEGDPRALRALVQTPLAPRSLIAAGVELDPALSFRLVALLVDPGSTTAERFSIAHRPAPDAPSTATLHILDGAPPGVSEPVPGQIEPAATTTVLSAPGDLLRVLLGDREAAVFVEGDERALSVLAGWLAKA